MGATDPPQTCAEMYSENTMLIHIFNDREVRKGPLKQ